MLVSFIFCRFRITVSWSKMKLNHNISWLLAVNVLERRAQAITKDAAQLLIFFPGLLGNFHHPLEAEIVVLRQVVQMVCAFGHRLQLLLEALVWMLQQLKLPEIISCTFVQFLWYSIETYLWDTQLCYYNIYAVLQTVHSCSWSSLHQMAERHELVVKACFSVVTIKEAISASRTKIKCK